uniref:Uncharacterized protein n=1 Tax=Arundo donax TaxID=35708 RepID=A0A0A8XNN3_ARUDO
MTSAFIMLSIVIIQFRGILVITHSRQTISSRKIRVAKWSASPASRFSRQLLLSAASFSKTRFRKKLSQTGPRSRLGTPTSTATRAGRRVGASD